ncbi:MAG: hypothetical protein H5T60_13155 [Anaerolineae bacterium]|nr:hypothetical protein [Anaerolineae bacterium]
MWDWAQFFSFGDLIFAIVDLIIAFSLLTYIFSRNLTSPVSRTFGAILTCVTVVYAGDVIVSLIDDLPRAIPWMRFQWLGIAILPAVYLHFSDSVLNATGLRSRRRRAAIVVAYALSLAALVLALFSDLIVQDGVMAYTIKRLTAGPLFWGFAAYFALATVVGGINVWRARQRCLTPTSIRRMTYLSVAYIAPALGTFPFLLVASPTTPLPYTAVLALAAAGNFAVAVMLVIMGYSVAYYGVLSPDRVVKHSMIHFLLRGPFVGICVIILMLIVPRVESILGLPRDTMLIFSAMLLIVLLELAIELAEPFIDRLIYRQDLAELEWLQELDKRLLTTTDLKQFLENLLTALCELLRVRTGFVASLAGGKWQLETVTGDLQAVQRCLEEFPPEMLFHPPDSARTARLEPSRAEFIRTDGFWVLPLRTRNREATLGLLGLYIDAQEEPLSLEAGEAVDALIAQAEIALEDRHLQQGVFAALRSIIPEIERIQRWRGTVRYDVGEPLEIIKDSPVYAPEYQRWVKEALAHYWGGPKLSQSPLLNLRVVSRRLRQQETSPVNALRATLAEAIEALRPAGPRHMTASEWLLYNILEMRYIQGKRVRDIADTLAMSESDLYRKQRIAIEQVARVLADMERQAGEES